MLCGNFHLTSTHSCYEAIIDLMVSTGGAARQGGAHRALPLPVVRGLPATLKGFLLLFQKYDSHLLHFFSKI